MSLLQINLIIQILFVWVQIREQISQKRRLKREKEREKQCFEKILTNKIVQFDRYHPRVAKRNISFPFFQKMTDWWDVRNSGRATIYEDSCPFNIVRFLSRKVSMDEYPGKRFAWILLGINYPWHLFLKTFDWINALERS